MSFQVVVRAVRNTLQLAPSHRKEILDVDTPLRVEGEFIRGVLADPDIVLSNAVFLIPCEPLVDPLLMPLLVCPGRYEVLDLHLLELAGAESKVAGCNLIAEGLADLCDTEGYLLSRGLEHIVEIDENALRGLRPEVSLRGGLSHRSEKGLEHQVRGLRRRQF